ncbi:MAG: hypothetical protein ACM65K_08010 [Microcoleus sp.]
MNKLLKFTMCLAAATLAHVFTFGFINDAQAQPKNRSDLNGLLIAHPSNGKVYWIDEGKRRWIAGPNVFDLLFPGRKVQEYIDVELIQEASPLTMENRVVLCKENGHRLNNKAYLLDQGTKRWVAGPKAFERNFVLKAVTPISCPALVSIPDGRPIQ